MVNVLNLLEVVRGVMNIVPQKRVGRGKSGGWSGGGPKDKKAKIVSFWFAVTESAVTNGLKGKSSTHKFRMYRNEKRPT